MKKIIPCICLFLISLQLLAQEKAVSTYDAFMKSTTLDQDKLLSGKLYELLYNHFKKGFETTATEQSETCKVFIYMEDFPDQELMAQFEDAGITLYRETWTPPIGSHPLGFIGAEVPVHQLLFLLETEAIKKINYGGRMSRSMNNTAGLLVGAPLVWATGNKGKGEKICILDSGIDLRYAGTDLPAAFPFKDYSDFPNLDDDVANITTGHGTHVAATALGRGILSQGHDQEYNGKGPFYGIAPEADLIFLKIGRDIDAMAPDMNIVAAIDAAVNIYKADIISMSYGGWDEHLDGTYFLDQKADWAYFQGVPFITSAGNAAMDDKHWKGTVPALSESDFIEIYVEDTGGDSTMLYFNMVWRNNVEKSGLLLEYFDENKQPLNNVIQFPITTSSKGTHSRLSYYETPITEPGTYYLKISNQTSKSQEVHLYEFWYFDDFVWSEVYFSESDPGYTIGSPAAAEHVFAVGAYVTRTAWNSALNSVRWWGPQFVINGIAEFSSHGPTLDERIKPDICAPGHVVISLRDQDVYKEIRHSWVDNDGIPDGDANYYSMMGTSMACPVVAGAAALYLNKYPEASPRQLYDALKRTTNKSGLEELPDNIWGHGRLNVSDALRGSPDPITVNGDMSDDKYTTLATFTSNRNGFGDNNRLGALKYYSDGKKIFLGVTGEVSENNNIQVFIDFSGVQGRGARTLGGGHPDNFVFCAFSYMNNVRMDFDVDFALEFQKWSSEIEFFCDAIRYGDINDARQIGKTNQTGGCSTLDISKPFGGNGNISFAYKNDFAQNNNHGVEMAIDLSAFDGVDISQQVRFFVVITSLYSDVSNVCIPGDPGPGNLGANANFAVIPFQDFFTQWAGIAAPQPTTLMISNEGPGYLIDKLISQGHGTKNLYETVQLLKPFAGDAIPQAFADKLAGCPVDSEIKQTMLNDFNGLNNPVGVNDDCSLLISGIYGGYAGDLEGWVTYPIEFAGTAKNRLFSYATNPAYYLDTGISLAKAGNDTPSNYKAFAVAWSGCTDVTIEEDVSICAGESYTWQGSTLTETGQYTLTLQTEAGCDSTLVLNLQVHPHFENVLDISICQGDAFEWRGNQYAEEGTFTEALTSVFGCDSTYVLNLSHFPVYETVTDAAICQGESYNWRDNSYTVAGQYLETLQTVDGCDSLFLLNLQVHPVYEEVTDAATCQGDSYPWLGNSYTEAGQYLETLQTVNGCDSLFLLNLQVHPWYYAPISEQICQGESLSWQGNTYSETGSYTKTLQTIHGCDSILVLNLNVYQVNTSVTVDGPVITANEPGAGYQWVDCNNQYAPIPQANSQSYNASSNGSYAVVVTREGCIAQSECIQVTQVSVDAPQIFSNIRVFPNPTTGNITIDGIPQGESATITIRDFAGRIIFMETIGGKGEISALVAEPSGMYLLEVVLANGSMRSIVVKTSYGSAIK